MKAGELCIRDTAIITSDGTAVDVAKLMRDYNVGSLVVVEKYSDGNKPIGIITDRDLVVEVFAQPMTGETVRVSQIMSGLLLTINENTDVYEALQHMRYKGVRRVPVTDSAGYLVGILAIDDILYFLTKEMNDILEILRKEEPVID